MAKVILYSTPTCPFCQKAEDYLREKKIDFENVNVAIDREGLRKMKEKSGQIGVPVLDVNGEIILGFNREKIDEVLRRQVG